MADQARSKEATSSPSSTASQPVRHSLSCTHCRQRKIKCDKVYPCTPCKRSSFECVFPERVQPSKKKRSNAKATNDDLMRRLGRMEELIEKMKAEGKGTNNNKAADAESSRSPSMSQISREVSGASASQEDGRSNITGDGTTEYIGSAFFRSLTNEVEGLKQTMDDVSDEEGTQESGQTPSDTQSPKPMIFGSSPLPSADLRMLHPNSTYMSALCEIYIENVDPMAKCLHTPSLRNLVSHAGANIQGIPPNSYVEALLFAMYYAAITSLTHEECLQQFNDGRELLLARYKMGVETALSNANLLGSAEMGTLQALVIYLCCARTNDDTLLIWSLCGVAIRLAHALGLQRENPKARLPPFQLELRRRLWWLIIQLDIRCTEDRGTDPMILRDSFNTKRPLNIHDSDMDPGNMEPLVERLEFTAMTKTYVSNYLWDTCVQIGFNLPVREADENLQPTTFLAEKLLLVDQLEKSFENGVLIYCNSANPLQWLTSVVIRLIMARLRLAIYHPPTHDDRSASHHLVNRDDVLKTAVQILEYTHLVDFEPGVARWNWHSRTHVQWHALAATLAELCVRNRGSLVDRAWTVVDAVFDDSAARIADSKSGMLWRPIKKLMTKAQSKRNEAKFEADIPMPQPQRPLPSLAPLSPSQDSNFADSPYHPNSVLGLSQKYDLDQGMPSAIMSTLNVNDSMDTINWAQWDEFMQEFEMTDPGTVDPNVLQQDANSIGAWW